MHLIRSLKENVGIAKDIKEFFKASSVGITLGEKVNLLYEIQNSSMGQMQRNPNPC